MQLDSRETRFTTHTCMQGMCNSAAKVETEQLVPSPRACVLDVHEDFLEASNSTRALLLSHLYVRLRGTGGRSTATLILNKARALWLSHVALQGNAVPVRGMDVYENSRVYIAGAAVCVFLHTPLLYLAHLKFALRHRAANSDPQRVSSCNESPLAVANPYALLLLV